MSYTLEQINARLDEVVKKRDALNEAEEMLRSAACAIRVARLPEYKDDKLIWLYLNNRDNELARIKEAAEAAEKVVKDEQHAIETELAKRLRERGADNTKTGSGTAFFKETTSVTTQNKDEFTRWVIGGEHWSEVDWRPSKSAIEDMLAAQEEAKEPPQPPPGIKVESIVKVHVRKA